MTHHPRLGWCVMGIEGHVALDSPHSVDDIGDDGGLEDQGVYDYRTAEGDDPLEHAVNLNIFGRGPIHLDIPHTLRSLQTDKDYAKPLVPPPSQLSLPSVQPAPPLSDIISPTPRTRSSQATPAHILTASAPICKDLVERLCTRHVETGTFERLTAPTPTPHPEFKYSLPLQEIDILVGGFNREAGIIDLGSQVVVIRKDLADEVAARINPGVRLEMK